MPASSLFHGKRYNFAMAAMQAHLEPPGVETLGEESLIFPSDLLSPPPLNSSAMEEKQEVKIHCTREDENEDEDEDEDGDEEEEGEEEDNACWASYGRRSPARRFPPAIPLLARTGNLSAHMPWVLKRTYKDDGSLVIQEVRVKHHEYFRARRADGRLTLQLMQMWPEQQIEEEIAKEEEKEKEKEMKTSSPSLPSLFLEEEDEGVEEENESMNTEAEGQENGASTPRCAMSSLMESSFTGISKGCFPEEGSSPIHQMPVSRLRAVET